MWYDKHGAGESLVMLHPGGVDSRAYGPNLQDFASRYTVFRPEQRNAMHMTGPTLTVDDLRSIRCRTLAMFGDDDEVRLEHAIAFSRNVPNCELAIIPGTSHGLLLEKPAFCDRLIIDFLTNDPVFTMAPRRRA